MMKQDGDDAHRQRWYPDLQSGADKKIDCTKGTCVPLPIPMAFDGTAGKDGK